MSSGRLACGPRPNDRFTAAWPAKPLPHPGARWVMRSGSAHNCRERRRNLMGSCGKRERRARFRCSPEVDAATSWRHANSRRTQSAAVPRRRHCPRRERACRACRARRWIVGRQQLARRSRDSSPRSIRRADKDATSEGRRDRTRSVRRPRGHPRPVRTPSARSTPPNRISRTARRSRSIRAVFESNAVARHIGAAVRSWISTSRPRARSNRSHGSAPCSRVALSKTDPPTGRSVRSTGFERVRGVGPCARRAASRAGDVFGHGAS